ncbi:MAG: helix-turn-helix domain-containing protein [Chloroflexi bacterium]|nr:helix-turn-helix domain-containing protein [Chloroflexota bacterium]
MYEYERKKDDLITVRDAAKVCGRNPETVRRWIWDDRLPAEKLGNQLFIRRSALDNFCYGTKKKQPEREEDFLERAIALRKKMQARGVKPIDVAAEVRKIREERQNELNQRLRRLERGASMVTDNSTKRQG